MDKNVAVIGCGYWGKNLVRNMAELGALACVADAHAPLANAMSEQHKVPAVSVDAITSDASIKGVVIASSAVSHAPLAAQMLEAGKHVFVEKPLALKVEEAETLAALAKKKERVLMVGHLLQYHPAYIALREEVKKGRIGSLRYVQSHRLSLGKIRTEENVIWSFAPHDISMVLGLTGEAPQSVRAHASAFVNKGIADIATLHLQFANVSAHIMVSWLHPVKEHKLTVIGESGALVFDDTQPWEQKLMHYPHAIDMSGTAPAAKKGDAVALPLTQGEPLKMECEHFLQAMQGSAVRTDAAEAIRVLKVLAAAEV